MSGKHQIPVEQEQEQNKSRGRARARSKRCKSSPLTCPSAASKEVQKKKRDGVFCPVFALPGGQQKLRMRMTRILRDAAAVREDYGLLSRLQAQILVLASLQIIRGECRACGVDPRRLICAGLPLWCLHSRYHGKMGRGSREQDCC